MKRPVGGYLYIASRPLASHSRQRNQSGNMMVLALIVLGLLCYMIGTFGLKYVSLLGSNHEQKTAIESAALAGADALAKIVIEDPELGFVGVADKPPTGTATAAGDNYYLAVNSVNSLLGRTRLDMIIAEQLQDSTMKSLALADYQKVIKAKDSLVSVLKTACLPGSTAKDADGKTVNVYDAAMNAYKSNAVRIVGPKSAIDEKSLTIKIGTIPGVSTNCRAPYPDQYRNAPADSFQDNYYKSSINIPFAQKDFVFAAAGDHSVLIDASQFQETISSLPYMIPTVINCGADHVLINNAGEKNVVHSSACAIAGASNQESPHSGFFCFNFSAGRIAKYNSPKDILWSNEIGHSPADLLQTAVDGDYPPQALADTTVDGSTSHPLMEKILKRSLYDWIKRGGSRLNVQSLIDMLNNDFPSGMALTTPQIVRYDINGAGNIDATVVETGSRYFLPVSNNQFFARTEFAIKDTTGKWYDLFIRDYVYKQGRSSADGGIHAGEPIFVTDFMGPPAKPDEPKGTFNKALDQDTFLAASFPTSPGGKRDTFIKPSVAVEIKLRLR